MDALKSPVLLPPQISDTAGSLARTFFSPAHRRAAQQVRPQLATRHSWWPNAPARLAPCLHAPNPISCLLLPHTPGSQPACVCARMVVHTCWQPIQIPVGTTFERLNTDQALDDGLRHAHVGGRRRQRARRHLVRPRCQTSPSGLPLRYCPGWRRVSLARTCVPAHLAPPWPAPGPLGCPPARSAAAPVAAACRAVHVLQLRAADPSDILTGRALMGMLAMFPNFDPPSRAFPATAAAPPPPPLPPPAAMTAAWASLWGCQPSRRCWCSGCRPRARPTGSR